MGWEFVEEDTSVQTNKAVDAIIRYAEAAKSQMEAYERYNPSCKIELYKDKSYSSNSTRADGVYIYIAFTITSDDDIDVIEDSNIIILNSHDYHDRCIEIVFYINYRGTPSKYKLVLYYNNQNLIENNKENNRYELISRGNTAYDFFISEIQKLRR